MIDGAQQCCSVLQVMSDDIDGIIHNKGTPAAWGSDFGSFDIVVLRGLLYICYFIHISIETKKKTCDTFL